MAGNFNISVANEGGHVRLKLNGDFDGSSACELANLIHNGGLSKTSRILINTDSVKEVFPFGVHILHSRLQNAKPASPDLIFTGKQSVRFASR
jgi:hypothetical protein